MRPGCRPVRSPGNLRVLPLCRSTTGGDGGPIGALTTTGGAQASTSPPEREQFGCLLAQFQAVQQHVARLAGEARVLDAAARAAWRALDGDDAAVVVGAAKAAGSTAAGEVAATAHQLLGAIGFTGEHALHRSTTRLWAWRQEFGNDCYWSARVGEAILAADLPVWQQVTGV